MTTILGLFETYEQADKAVRILRERGFAESDISVLAREQSMRSDYELSRQRGQKDDPTGMLAGIGAATGGSENSRWTIAHRPPDDG